MFGLSAVSPGVSTVTTFVSVAKPAPGVRRLLATSMSQCLPLSFFAALASRSRVSMANPHNVWSGRLCSPAQARMSGFDVSSSSMPLRPFFLILSRACSTGRKSPTAAAMTVMSVSEKRLITTSNISRAVVTSTTSTPYGASNATGPDTSVTCAPRSRACSAKAYPILPVEWLVRNRTGSSGSCVGPAVTSTASPLSGSSPSGRFASSSAFTAVSMRAGSSIRPLPASPQASMPLSGSTIVQPSSRQVLRLRCVTAFSYICTFMAGHRIFGPLSYASMVLVSWSSAMPQAIFAMISALAGATASRSAHFASATWLICSGPSGPGATSAVAPGRCPAANMDVRVGVWVRELNVRGVTNSCAAAVITTRTSCPCLLQSEARWQALNAAMLPVTPKRICAMDQPSFSL